MTVHNSAVLSVKARLASYRNQLKRHMHYAEYDRLCKKIEREEYILSLLYGKEVGHSEENR